jgi:hypothetical protein
MLSASSLFTSNYSNFDNDTNLETSATNTLFNGKSYPFELKDVYDDENYTKIYTDAYLQTEYNQNGTIVEDQVSVVNNTCYKSPSVDGHYPATNSFKNEADGTSGPDIDFVDYVATGASAEIIGEVDGHKKLLNVSETVGTWKEVHHYVDDPQITGTVEFWIYLPVNTKYYTMLLGSPNGIYIAYRCSGTLGVYDGSWQDYGDPYSSNIWYHNKIVFNCTSDTFEWYVNGEQIGGTFNFQYGIDTVSKIALRNYNSYCYYDAIDISIDPSYEEGRNLYSKPITMLNGTFDNSNNMKVNDGSNSEFTSVMSLGEEIMRPDADGVTTNWVASGAPPNHYENVDDDVEQPDAGDGNYIYTNVINQLEQFELEDVGVTVSDYICWIRGYVNGGGDDKWYDVYIDYNDAGGWILIGRASFVCSAPIAWTSITVNGINKLGNGWKIQLKSDNGLFGCTIRSYVIYLDCEVYGSNLNFTIDLDFNELDASKLLALDVSSYHYTNISTTIIGNIYNYDTSSYTQMFSSSNTVETENYFMDNILTILNK